MEVDKLYLGDALEILKQLPDNSIDAVVTDPPYGLKFMNKKWDYDVPSVELWREVFRVMKPGAHLLSFFGTRTYHRGVINIEDAGFEIRDMIQWLYGSGFPKSMNISKAIGALPKKQDGLLSFAEQLKKCRKELGLSITEADKLITGGTTMYAFLEGRRLNGKVVVYPPSKKIAQKIEEVFNLKVPESLLENNLEVLREETGNFGYQKDYKRWQNVHKVYKAISPEAQQWQGWGTSLKPACEPIVLARKPISEKNIAQNVLKWGTGGLNIDESRIEYHGTIKTTNRKSNYTDFAIKVGSNAGYKQPSKLATPTEKGRFPANIILDEEAAKILDKQSGISKSNDSARNRKTLGMFNYPNNRTREYRDKGGASRFFYVAKASKKERWGYCHFCQKPIKAIDVDKHVHDAQEKYGNKYYYIEFHPTVKPLKLIKYLIKLITPNGGIVLDPFIGTGTTAVACRKLGYHFIGIDNNKIYIEIAKARMKNLPNSLDRFI